MQAISDALNRLLEDGSWFARAREIQLLAVRASGDLRKTALRMLAGLEFHHDNRSAWLLFEDAHTRADPGWQSRANRWLAHWEDRRAVFLKNEGIEMPPAPAPGQAASLGENRALAPFRGAATAVLSAMRPPLEGWVLVIAPTIAEDVEALGREIEALMKDSVLGGERCRWVWVLDAAAPWPSLLDRVGPERSIRCVCVPDPKQHDADLHALVSSPSASFGRAAPRGVKPPVRVDAPPPVDPAIKERMLREAGLTPEYLEKAPELQRLVLGAALAMKDGKGEEAVGLQRRAVELAASLGLAQVTVIGQVALGGYLSALDQRERAVTELVAAVELATRHDLGLPEAQARLALALVLALERRFPEAAHEYATCAQRAEKADVPLLAIEAWRLAAQLASQLGAHPQAMSCLREALRVASGADPEVIKISSAPEAARRLAVLCRERGLAAQAESLYAQADAMERGEVEAPGAAPQAAAQPRPAAGV